MTNRKLPTFRALVPPVDRTLARLTARGGHEWYRVEAKGDDEVEVWIYDEIGYWGIAADDFVRALADVDAKTISLRLNSPGGSVFDGVAIYNALVRHPATVNVSVDGVAASIASVIAMSGDTITMGRGTRMMIHNPSGFAGGQASDFRAFADLLDELGRDIAGFYAHRAGGSVDQWLATMEGEKWFSAQEAVEAGLADSILGADDAPKDSGGEVKVFDLSAFGFKYADRDEYVAAESTRRATAALARVRATLKGAK